MSFGIEIPSRELAGARIGSGVVGRNDAIALERLEIVRRVVPMQNGSRFVLAAVRAIHARAADARSLVVEPPHAQPFDPQGARGDLEDAPQPFVERLARDWCSAR